MPRSKRSVTATGDNRTRLLQLSAELFAQQGYARVSVRDLASRLDLTTGAIYSNFRSKGDLLAEVLDLRVREDMERDRPDTGPGDPDITLPAFVRQSFLRLDERATMRALLLEAAAAARTDATLQARVRPDLSALLDRWIADYRDWQEIRHVDRDLDMDALVRSLWAIELGLGVLDAQGVVGIEPGQLADFVGAYLDSLEQSDRPRDGARPSRRTGDRSPAPGAGLRNRPAPLTPVSGRRDSPKAMATQSRLVEAAIDLFAEKGYVAVSVRDIAYAASMTTGSIYGNFANKANLLVEVIEARITEDLEQLPPDLLALSAPADLVEFNFLASTRRRELRALLVEGAAAARSDPEVRARLGELQERHLHAWAEGLDGWGTRAPGSPGTPYVDTTTAVTVAWCAELGLGLMEALGLTVPPADAQATTFAAMFRVAGFGDAPGRACGPPAQGGSLLIP